MRPTLLTLSFLLCLSTSALAQHSGMNMEAAEKPPALMSGLGSLHHPVSTTNQEAQRFFNQGLALVFAFNHDEAVRSFKRAVELDPKLNRFFARTWKGTSAMVARSSV